MLPADISQAIQLSFVSASAAAVLIRSITPLRDRFIAYGSRASTEQPGKLGSKKKDEKTVNVVTRALDMVGSWQVPHSWFRHFYLTSVLSSAFWSCQLLFGGRTLQSVKDMTPGINQSMSNRRIIVACGLLLIQGSRRLYESVCLSKPSQSKMSIAHWFTGIWFYLTMGIAIWIEGVPSLRSSGLEWGDFSFVPPSPSTFIAFVVFALASGAQHDCHAYLSSLRGYTIPAHPAFQKLLCPHYFSECLIYLSLSVLAAPKGALVNRTILCAFVFVVVNLGVTADSTRDWYVKKFGADSVKGKWRMVPFLF